MRSFAQQTHTCMVDHTMCNLSRGHGHGMDGLGSGVLGHRWVALGPRLVRITEDQSHARVQCTPRGRGGRDRGRVSVQRSFEWGRVKRT